jgi:hypothetical protein
MSDLREEAEALCARLREPVNVCGACGQPWGEKCGQADNGWSHPICYPYYEINRDDAADIITKLLSAWGAATERADHAEGFCYRASMAADKDGFVCAEAVALRAELAKVTGERDRLKVNFNLESNQFHDNQWRQLTEMAAELAAAREAVAKAVEDEREACAKIAETEKTLKAWLPPGPNGEGENQHATIHGTAIAAAIRARKEPTP